MVQTHTCVQYKSVYLYSKSSINERNWFFKISCNKQCWLKQHYSRTCYVTQTPFKTQNILEWWYNSLKSLPSQSPPDAPPGNHLSDSFPWNIGSSRPRTSSTRNHEDALFGASLTRHNIFAIHPCCSMYESSFFFFLIAQWVISCGINISRFINSLIVDYCSVVSVGNDYNWSEGRCPFSFLRHCQTPLKADDALYPPSTVHQSYKCATSSPRADVASLSNFSHSGGFVLESHWGFSWLPTGSWNIF